MGLRTGTLARSPRPGNYLRGNGVPVPGLLHDGVHTSDFTRARRHAAPAKLSDTVPYTALFKR